VHLAVELVDRLFLNGDDVAIQLLTPVFVPSQEVLGVLYMTPPRAGKILSEEEETLLEKEEIFEMTRIRHLALYTATCFIIAAKYDELDENIPLIQDLQRYYTIKVLPPQIPAPSPEEVVECERIIMHRVY
jgi:hypothetical protein